MPQKLNESLKIIVKTSFIVLISLFFARVVGYLYRIIIARYLGPEEYGLFILAAIILSFFTAIASFGLTEGIVRFIPFYRGRKQIKKIRYIYKFSISILFASSIFFALLLFFSSDIISLKLFHNSNLVIYLKIFSFLIPISIFSTFFLNILRSYEQIKWISFISNILSNATKLILLILLVAFSIRTGAIIASYSLGFLIVLLVSYYVCRYKIPEIFLQPVLKSQSEKLEIRKNLFSYSWPILFISLAGSILYWIDSFFIGYFKSAADVGFYNAAVPLAALFIVSSEIFTQLFYPMITKEYSRNNFKLIKEISKQIGKWVFIINLPLFLIIVLFPGVIINVLFGFEYLIAENALRILSFAMLFVSISMVSYTLLLVVGKTKIILLSLISVSIINIILDIIFVPVYGFIGAAFSTMFCQILLGVITMHQANKYIGIIPLRRKMLRVFFISLIPLTIVVAIKNLIAINIFILILLGILFLGVYSLLIFLTGCLDKNDMLIFMAIKKRIFS